MLKNLAQRSLRECLQLYLVTDTSCTRGRPLLEVVDAAVRGGVTCVQLRDKNLNTRDFLAQAAALKSLLMPLGIDLVINDRVDIALLCGAQGVHLGQSDMSVEEARRLLPSDIFIGWSVETMDDVIRSVHLPLDYLGVSPVFATPTKTDTAAPWGLAGLRQIRIMSTLPLVAIGGINLSCAADVLDAGADGLAVVSALCAASDPCATAQSFQKIINQRYFR